MNIIYLIVICIISFLYFGIMRMKKQELKKKTNIIKEYLISQSLIKEGKYLFKMDFNPDYDYTDSEKNISQIYYFHEKIDFSDIFYNIISYSDIKPHILSPYDLDLSLNDYLTPIEPEELEEIKEKEVPTEFDEFKLNKIHLYSYDNVNKTLNYDCTCKTERMFLGDDFVDIYCEVDLTGISNNFFSEKLYNQLIVDSYLKYLQKDYRMAFFLMYSAFECFINLKSGKPEEEKRLVQKKNELFKTRFKVLNLNNINSSVNMSNYEKTRNDIAHGKENFNISKKLVDDIYFDFISLIISFEKNIKNYNELRLYLKKWNKEL